MEENVSEPSQQSGHDAKKSWLFLFDPSFSGAIAAGIVNCVVCHFYIKLAENVGGNCRIFLFNFSYSIYMAEKENGSKKQDCQRPGNIWADVQR